MTNTFIQDLFFAKLELVDNLFTALVNDQDETIIYAMSIIITIWPNLLFPMLIAIISIGFNNIEILYRN